MTNKELGYEIELCSIAVANAVETIGLISGALEDSQPNQRRILCALALLYDATDRNADRLSRLAQLA